MHHIGLVVSDLPKALAFYDAVLEPLGAKRVMNAPTQSIYGNKNGIFFVVVQAGKDVSAEHRQGTHYAFKAESPKQIDAWYEAAIKAGAKDNGKPGPRPNYGPHFYGAFVHDPIDGHHIEACMTNYEAEAPKYKVSYFGIRGRGEQVRLMLSELGLEFEDNRLTRDQFVALQKQENSPLTFGSVPLLEEGKKTLVQGGAILSYLAKRHGIYPSDLHDGAVADSIVMGAEDFRIKVFNEPTTKAKQSKEGKSEAEVAEIEKAGESLQAFLKNTWHARWAGQFERILKNSGTGFCVTKSLTHADIAVFDVIDHFITQFGSFWKGFDENTAHLAKFYETIKARTNIAKWIAKRA